MKTKEERIKELIPLFEQGCIYFPDRAYADEIDLDSQIFMDKLSNEAEVFPDDTDR